MTRHTALLTFALLLIPAARAEVPAPKVPEPAAQGCIARPDVMRRTHMSLLMHQRDQVVHQGERDDRRRFDNCLACHVRPRADGSYPAADSRDHFCNTCHAYAAVSIDCFSCHNSRPSGAPPVAAEAGRAPLGIKP